MGGEGTGRCYASSLHGLTTTVLSYRFVPSGFTTVRRIRARRGDLCSARISVGEAMWTGTVMAGYVEDPTKVRMATHTWSQDNAGFVWLVYPRWIPDSKDR